jgi:hypothetical protein
MDPAMVSRAMGPAVSRDKAKVMPMHGRGTSAGTRDMAVQASMQAVVEGGNMISEAMALVVGSLTFRPGTPSRVSTQHRIGRLVQACMGKTTCKAKCKEDLHRARSMKCMDRDCRTTKDIHIHL